MFENQKNGIITLLKQAPCFFICGNESTVIGGCRRILLGDFTSGGAVRLRLIRFQ
jgi:hypothetical protein